MMFGQEMNTFNNLSRSDRGDRSPSYSRQRSTGTLEIHDVVHRAGKVKVEIVVQFFKVGEIDTLKEQFNADVIVKAKWREPTLDGQQTTADAIDFARLWSPKLYIENSLGDPKEQIRHRIIYNEKGEAFIYEKRVAKGTFMENLELDDFPFDVQDLTITVASELPISECELVEDKDEHHVVNRQSFVDEQEWHLYVHTECNKKELVIDQVDNSVKRSALSVKCRAARRPGYFVWNIFMITFLICSLAFATFSVEKDLPQNRLQLSFTLVLTAVAFKSVVNSSLPRISYLTYMDKYLLVSMVMLSAVCTWHAIVTRLNYNRKYADHVENIVLTILSVLYIVYNIGFIVIIYLFPCKKRRIMSQKDKEYKRNRRSFRQKSVYVDSLSRTQVAKYKRKPRRQALEQNENINVTAKY
ncbi:cys-loop ligand-gated ion channel-like isoform X6 [Mercenaria mercenaria]|uniref:cys-loop ligand-gated ion channel-like isoform X6 n=1 Tax=Mercenaria mercenaria TaxID=6596 RepID=UPI00234E83FB|nr:cys-loop ligand-gated ion channel-like isoform X6 [Mercenaria mercenaria]XP_045177558.2 cys-loop ligand-gated ion channel-like isoform X6 [Mercenaria mercenaria]